MCQDIKADEKEKKDKYSSIILCIKCKNRLIVRLKAIKSRKDTFYYLFCYFYYSFL